MSCISAEILSDLAASTANGEAMNKHYCEALAHIESCDACGEAYAVQLGVAQNLRDALLMNRGQRHAGGACLDDERFAAYLDRSLDTEERAEVEAHLARCGACFEQLLELTELCERTADARPGPFRYVIGAVAGRLDFLAQPEDGSCTITPLRPAAVLGRDDAPGSAKDEACAWKQQAGDVELDFLAVRSGAGQVNLTVQVSDATPPPRSTRLSIWADGKLVQSECVPTTGCFEIPALDLQCYEGEVELANGRVIPFEIDLRP